jgi:hypothetical protein
MSDEAQIPRSRGTVCGALLILLGLWGGLAPFVGPYFHFGFTPDTAWHYNLGRLYYSIIPGAAALLAGILITVTRNRVLAIAGGVLAALGGAWFVVGNGFVTDVLHRSISQGVPLLAGVSGTNAVDLRSYLELLALFSGLGVLILLLGAIVMGRFSMVAAKDVAAADYQADFQAPPPVTLPDLSKYPTSVGQRSSATDPFTATTTTTQSGSPPFAPAPFPDTTTGQIPPSDQPG